MLRYRWTNENDCHSTSLQFTATSQMMTNNKMWAFSYRQSRRGNKLNEMDVSPWVNHQQYTVISSHIYSSFFLFVICLFYVVVVGFLWGFFVFFLFVFLFVCCFFLVFFFVILLFFFFFFFFFVFCFVLFCFFFFLFFFWGGGSFYVQFLIQRKVVLMQDFSRCITFFCSF